MFRRLLPIALAGCGRIGFSSTTEPPADDGMLQDTSADAEPQPLQNGCATTHPGVLLCEGFEEPGVMWDYTVFEGGGTAARSTLRGAQGSASLEAQLVSNDSFKGARWGKNNVLPSLTSGELHIREYVWLTGSTTIEDQLSIFVTGNQVDPFPSANVMLTPGMIHAVVPGSDAAVPFEFPRDRWVCMEVHLTIATLGTFVVDIDGAPAVQRAAVDTTVAGGYTNIDVGFHYATPMQPAATIFIDEVVADTSPIGCN